MPQPVSRPFSMRRALLQSLAPRYQQASSTQKTLLLDAVVEWTGYTRKYAIELLNHGMCEQQAIRRHRASLYGPAVQQALILSWKAAHYVCAKRLLPFLATLVASLERFGHLSLSEEHRHQLLTTSVSTAKQYLRTQPKPRGLGCSATTSGPGSSSQLPVCLVAPWERERPGFVEVDLVAHGGSTLDGSFLIASRANNAWRKSLKKLIFRQD